jgi:hypothetical protein
MAVAESPRLECAFGQWGQPDSLNARGTVAHLPVLSLKQVYTSSSLQF